MTLCVQASIPSASSAEYAHPSRPGTLSPALGRRRAAARARARRGRRVTARRRGRVGTGRRHSAVCLLCTLPATGRWQPASPSRWPGNWPRSRDAAGRRRLDTAERQPAGDSEQCSAICTIGEDNHRGYRCHHAAWARSLPSKGPSGCGSALSFSLRLGFRKALFFSVCAEE